MQKWVTLLLGAAVVALAVVLMVKGFSPAKPVIRPLPEAGATDGGAAAASTDAASADNADAAPVLLSDLVFPEGRFDGGAGYVMPDGKPVPPIPDGAPKFIRFGVVLLEYAGAQFAKPNARTKAQAKELAEKLSSEGQADFHASVTRGDPGSQDDAGRIFRGQIEPAIEYQLFTLTVGQVSAPIDTPRGFWIVKRLE
jgi:hypothetical protein